MSTRYKDGNNHFIGKAKAIELGWANEDGTPTPAYEAELLARREKDQKDAQEPTPTQTADGATEPAPGEKDQKDAEEATAPQAEHDATEPAPRGKRQKSTKKPTAKQAKDDAPAVSAERPCHAGIPSPYDLERRSGYRVIWQVLAESANKVVPWDVLQKEVNHRLATAEGSAEWYEANYAKEGHEYDCHSNAIVINRAPYNREIEKLKQRVIISAEGAMLMTNVTTPRILKKGRAGSTTKIAGEQADR